MTLKRQASVQPFGARRLPRVHPGGSTRPVHRLVDRLMLGALRRTLNGVPVGLSLWDEHDTASPSAPPVATIRLLSRSALLRVIVRPDLYFGEEYMAGRLEVTGDLVGLLEAIYTRAARRPALVPAAIGVWLSANTRPRARHNVHVHYDLGNDFYQLWLDRQMVYTCAYFPTGGESLEQAQIAKMDYVCRKLRLRPGERVVEAGCGWGALALHMARHYGVSVDAYNVSGEQIRYARALAAREGLGDRVSFIEDDYRAIRGRYEVFVSVGMLEHVGRPHYRTLGSAIRRSLDRGGRGLLHFIGRTRRLPLNPWIRRRIFPGAYPPTLADVTAGLLEPSRLGVVDVENLRRHYVLTLQHWLDRYERHIDQVPARFDERFARAWRLYLAGSLAAFTAGSLQLYQLVFVRDGDDALPATRADLYRDAAPGGGDGHL